MDFDERLDQLAVKIDKHLQECFEQDVKVLASIERLNQESLKRKQEEEERKKREDRRNTIVMSVLLAILTGVTSVAVTHFWGM